MSSPTLQKRTAFWMALSGLTGLLLFVIANFTSIFSGSSVLAGCLQLIANTFVFISWSRGFQEATGLQKFIALLGTIVPVIMGTITIVRVLLPPIL